jgi:hypothetical protein
MTITNNQISNSSKNILKSFVGQNLKTFSHEAFTFINISYGAVFLIINEKIYSFTDYYKVRKLIGYDEEISYIQIKQVKQVKSTIENQDFVNENLNLKITKIELVNSIQTAVDKTTHKIYKTKDTHGIIFTFEDNYQLSLEKDDCGENIFIYRGYDARKEFDNLKAYLTEEYDENFEMSCKITFEEI